MQKLLHELDQLAALARREVVPEVDVLDGALHDIRVREGDIGSPVLALAAGALVAATLVLGFSIPLYRSLTDPLGPLFQMTQNFPL
jgi:hypothetical protein